MQSDGSQLAHESGSSALAGHPGPDLRTAVPPAIAIAIRALVPSGQHKAIEALLDNRARYGTIKHWRYGRRATPQWALDLVAIKLERISKALRKEKAAPGRAAGQINIATWHARKKEKAPD